MNKLLKDLLLTSIKSKLDDLREYANHVGSSLSKEAAAFASSTEEWASKLAPQERDELYDFYSDHHWRLDETFPYTLRSSFFVTCYSLLEYELDSLCRNFDKHGNYPISLNDIGKKKKGIFRSQRYLKKVINMRFPDSKASWSDILNYNRMRNIIAHNDGKFENDETDRAKKVKSFMKTKSPMVTLDSINRIQLSKEFCLEVIDTLECFFTDLFSVLP